MTDKYLYTTIAHKQKKIKKILNIFLNHKLLYHLIPSNILVLGLYKHTMFKRLSAQYRLQLLLRRRKKSSTERRQLLSAAKKGLKSLSSVQKTENSISHTLHTQVDYYTLTANAYMRVKIKCHTEIHIAKLLPL